MLNDSLFPELREQVSIVLQSLLSGVLASGSRRSGQLLSKQFDAGEYSRGAACFRASGAPLESAAGAARRDDEGVARDVTSATSWRPSATSMPTAILR